MINILTTETDFRNNNSVMSPIVSIKGFGTQLSKYRQNANLTSQSCTTRG